MTMGDAAFCCVESTDAQANMKAKQHDITYNQFLRCIVKLGAKVESPPLELVELLILLRHVRTRGRGVLIEPRVLRVGWSLGRAS